MNCIFCDIAAASERDSVYEDDRMIAISDISPQAPVHLLLMPKEHVERLRDNRDLELALLERAQILGDEHTPEGYRLTVNTGSQQEVKHLHIHIAGGQPLGRIAEEVTN